MQERLRRSFQYIVDLWPPKTLENRDITKILERITECQSFIDRKPTINSSYDRQVGYYLNNNRKGSKFPIEKIKQIESASEGFVVHNDWNQIMVFLEINNRYSLFYYFTGA